MNNRDYVIAPEWINRSKPNLLLTSAGRRSYLIKFFKDAMNAQGEVHALNSDCYSAALEVADKGTISPLIYSDKYIPFLLDYCKQNGIGAIIPLFDVDIPVLAKNKEKFLQIGCFPLVPNKEQADLCNDKLKTSSYLKENDLPALKTYSSLEKCLKAVNAGEIVFPIVVKPRWGMGSVGVFVANNEDELRSLFKIVINNIKDSYLKYETDFDEAVIFQEFAKGQEFGLDIINDLEGNFKSVVVKKKIKMRAGETDCAEVIEVNADFLHLAVKLSNLVRHPGNMDVDVILYRDRLYVLEMNPRFGGGYLFSHVCGVDLPKAIYLWLQNKAVEQRLLLPSKYGVFQKDIGIIELKTCIK